MRKYSFFLSKENKLLSDHCLSFLYYKIIWWITIVHTEIFENSMIIRIILLIIGICITIVLRRMFFVFFKIIRRPYHLNLKFQILPQLLYAKASHEIKVFHRRVDTCELG